MGHYIGMGSVSASQISAAQTFLKSKGFDPGPIDGVLGNKTKVAQNSYVNIVVEPNIAAVANKLRAMSNAGAAQAGTNLGTFLLGTGASLRNAGKFVEYQTRIGAMTQIASNAAPASFSSDASLQKVREFVTAYPAFDTFASTGSGGGGSTGTPGGGSTGGGGPSAEGSIPVVAIAVVAVVAMLVLGGKK